MGEKSRSKREAGREIKREKQDKIELEKKLTKWIFKKEWKFGVLFPKM